jgi:hypothetical protein
MATRALRIFGAVFAMLLWASPFSVGVLRSWAAAAPPDLDSKFDDAWHRKGCHRDPDNQAGRVARVAADCLMEPSDPACTADSDGDRRSDVAEARRNRLRWRRHGANRDQLPFLNGKPGLQWRLNCRS